MSKFMVGDTIIGNSLANRYFTITREGWIGVVVKVEDSGSVVARSNSPTSAKCYDGLPASCFDLYKRNKERYVSLW